MTTTTESPAPAPASRAAASDAAGAPIRVRGLVKRFGRLTALDGLDLTVAPGRVHGFLGQNFL